MNKQTDTPRTDEIARGNHVIPTEFAKDLERKLSAVTKERDEAKFDLEFRRDLYRLQKDQLATVTKQRDALAEALREMQYAHTDKSELMANEALSALNHP